MLKCDTQNYSEAKLRDKLLKTGSASISMCELWKDLSISTKVHSISNEDDETTSLSCFYVDNHTGELMLLLNGETRTGIYCFTVVVGGIIG